MAPREEIIMRWPPQTGFRRRGAHPMLKTTEHGLYVAHPLSSDKLAARDFFASLC